MTDYCQFCQQPIGPGNPSCPVPGHGKSGHHASCCPGGLEHDMRLLTQDERSAIRQGLGEMWRLIDTLYRDLSGLGRGAVASDLNHMMAITRQMRSTLLEFPDKPEGSTS
jgi:hypothetical protein